MIDKAYTGQLQTLRQAFHTDESLPSITLQDFFSLATYRQIHQQMRALSYTQEQRPLLHSYHCAPLSSKLNSLLNTSEFLVFVSFIIQQKVHFISWMAYILTWKDYILLHDSRHEKPGTDLIIDCTEDWPENAGGKIVYTDGQGNMFYVPPPRNALTIVHRTRKIQRYVQYCNHYAQEAKRYLLIGRVE